jgi:hypothetical protein
MSNGEPYTVISIGQGVIQDSQLRLVRTTQVVYKVGEDGPFTYVAPVDQQTPDQIRAYLLERAKQLRTIRGM